MRNTYFFFLFFVKEYLLSRILPLSMATERRNAHSLYSYEPLLSPTHTRILEIQPSMHLAAPLHCALRFMDLDEDPDYEALSYTWGAPGFTEKVIIDGNHYKIITPNLDDALRRFRLPVHVRRLWVDALCIDQDDPRDKARQIPNMGQIYRGATSVLAWLGNTKEADSYIDRINSITKARHSDFISYDVESDIRDALKDLSSLPWFSRRWII